MARSVCEVLNTSDMSGMLMIIGETRWQGMWLPLTGRRGAVERRRVSNSGDALARAAVANE